MESSNLMHLRIMKCIIPILIFIRVPCLAQDTLPIFSHHYLIEQEINCCNRAKDQLVCMDSLIRVNQHAISRIGKIDPQRAYADRLRKLACYHFYAGNISGLRGNLDQSFAYFDTMERYFDTLDQRGYVNEFETLKEITRYQKTEYCLQTYQKDTVAFHRCNCMQFFPVINDEFLMVDTTFASEKEIIPIKYPHWGQFYLRDTLRINNDFVSDSFSIVYFKQILQPVLLNKLQQNPYYFEMLGDPALNLVADTLIYRLSVNYDKGSYERKCELVFSSSPHPEWFSNFLVLLSNAEYPGFIRNLEIYIPIVVSTEDSNNNNVYVHDDHFRIEVEKIKPIKQLD